MDVSTALVAHAQAAELAPPAQGALHHPAVDAQSAAVFRSSCSILGRAEAPKVFEGAEEQHEND